MMRESYEKLLDICLAAVGGAPGGGWSGSGPSCWLSAYILILFTCKLKCINRGYRVESTRWLEHTCTILEAAERVVDCVHNQEISVLLHCRF